jgi:hypothetical protein
MKRHVVLFSRQCRRQPVDKNGPFCLPENSMARGLAFGRPAKITYLSDDIGKMDPFCTAECGDELKEL